MRFVLLVLLIVFSSKVWAQLYAPVQVSIDTSQFTHFLRHTSSVLHNREVNEFRLLIYGQSISMQDWWKEVDRFLKEQYPQIKITTVNKAIGGFSAEILKLVALNDVLSFYPDLILFHDYGNEKDYEEIIKIIRTNTTADIAVQTDHIAIGQNERWHEEHNFKWLPHLCRKYGLAYLDIRSNWKTYLETNKLETAQLLTDHVHLNDHGNYLMAEIIKQYLKKISTHTAKHHVVEIVRKIDHLKGNSNKIAIPVSGNRVDVIFRGSQKPKDISILMNGKKPSAFKDCYSYTRPSRDPGKYFFTNIGLPLTMRLGENVQEEEWTLKIKSVDTLHQQMTFSLQGSITGPDGEGSSGALFISNSKRVVIDSMAWFRRRNPDDFGNVYWLKPGNEIYWKVNCMCLDAVTSTSVLPTTIIQKKAGEPFDLILQGRLKQLQEIRIYNPSAGKQ